MKRKFPDVSIFLRHTPCKTLAKLGFYRLFHDGDGISISERLVYLKGKIAFLCQNKIYLV